MERGKGIPWEGEREEMLTKLTIRNFKLFEEVEIELGERVVFIGPNNSGKTSALQAIALWDIGVKRWLEKRSGDKKIPAKRPGVTINRQDLISIPVPSANLLWHDLRVRMAKRPQGRKGETHHVRVEIGVEGMDNGQLWQSNMEFDCANEESIYCRPPLCNNDTRMEVPLHLKNWQVAYLPPMSGLAALKEIGFEHYSLAKETGWVLYLEGSTDLAMLRAFAERLNHKVSTLLERPFVHYVANQPKRYRNIFTGSERPRATWSASRFSIVSIPYRLRNRHSFIECGNAASWKITCANERHFWHTPKRKGENKAANSLDQSGATRWKKPSEKLSRH